MDGLILCCRSPPVGPIVLRRLAGWLQLAGWLAGCMLAAGWEAGSGQQGQWLGQRPTLRQGWLADCLPDHLLWAGRSLLSCVPACL